MEIAPIVGFFGFFFFLGWTISVLLNGYLRKATLKARSELANRVLEKFGSSREFIELSESEGGKRLLATLGSEQTGGGTAERILGSLHKGVILATLGLGFLILSLFIPSEQAEVFRVLGGVTLSLGVGFVVSTTISHRFARSLGLLSSREHSSGPWEQVRRSQ